MPEPRDGDPLRSGERQVGATLGEIREDHVYRYRWARNIIEDLATEPFSVIDAGCGVGYGASILSESDMVARVQAFDCSDEAIRFADRHFKDGKTAFFPGSEYPFDAMQGPESRSVSRPSSTSRTTWNSCAGSRRRSICS